MSSVNVEDIGMDKVGLYSGTFDPVTNGHLDVIERGYEPVSYTHLRAHET